MYWGGLSAANAAAYQTGQTGYAVSHAPAAGTYTAQRAPSTYDGSYPTATSHAAASYPAPSTTYDYGYTARPPTQPTAAAAAAAAAAVYDTKTYYGQPAAAAAAAAAATVATPYTAAETHYQNAALRPSTVAAAAPKTSYAAGYSVTSASPAPYNTTSYTAQSTSAANKGTTGLYMQQTVQAAASAGVKAGGNTWQTIKKGHQFGGIRHNQKKPAPRPQQLHYCDVCKISCAGPQTYREHLEGQKHKKKEASAKAGPTPSRLGASLRCELCDVTCTGADAYAAHIRGAKHQKVVKLHEKLGKPIPSQDPVVVGGKTSAGTTSTSSGVAGGASTTTTTEVATSKSTSSSSSAANKKEMMADAKEDLLELKEKEVEPVGMEYIEEMKAAEGDGQGKVISFKCTLCDCRFNDPNAKEMHMKGRRHRLQYKKKVNPELQVEIKPSARQRKMQEEKLRRQQVREEVWRRREEELLLEQEERFLYDRSRRIDEPYDYMDWCQRFPPHRGPPPLPRPHHLGMGPPPPHPMMGPRHPFMHQGPPAMMRRPDSSDDRHVMARHADIYPSEEELAATQKIVSTTEKALKLVSDYLANLDAPKDSKKDVMKDVKIKKEPVAEKQELVKDKKERPKAPHGTTHFDTNDKKEEGSSRILKGVMRVGILAKGLLLRGDKTVELVVLCGEKPTRTLLDRVADALPQHLASLSGSTDEEQQYDVQRVVEEAAVQVTLGQHTVKVTLTAPVMREQLLQASSSGTCERPAELRACHQDHAGLVSTLAYLGRHEQLGP
ncbi:zinc finger RNA-binding protein isoform X2 [Hyalella azteca]|uniref:Zinc finger RNA-binding protein isoform X2 n=1 Tax=Hyalella azteca TaxID=294128 RepID=A0A8B7NAT2_HYAAZ|nr:zinc finger RNA-binding protein isoform X2 [Hyalella azteca]